jgi:hypothetical protein
MAEMETQISRLVSRIIINQEKANVWLEQM